MSVSKASCALSRQYCAAPPAAASATAAAVLSAFSGAAAGVALPTDAAAAAGAPAAAVPGALLRPSLVRSEPGPGRHHGQPLPSVAARSRRRLRAKAAARREGGGRHGAGEDVTANGSSVVFLNKYAEVFGELPDAHLLSLV